jgi:hypothetical protein
MRKKEASELHVQGKQVHCPVCHHDRFWTRRTLLNTRGASFFSFDWLNKGAVNQICDRCGHILWFYEG